MVLCLCMSLENRLFKHPAFREREGERERERERERLVVPGTCTPEGDGWREKWEEGRDGDKLREWKRGGMGRQNDSTIQPYLLG